MPFCHSYKKHGIESLPRFATCFEISYAQYNTCYEAGHEVSFFKSSGVDPSKPHGNSKKRGPRVAPRPKPSSSSWPSAKTLLNYTTIIIPDSEPESGPSSKKAKVDSPVINLTTDSESSSVSSSPCFSEVPAESHEIPAYDPDAPEPNNDSVDIQSFNQFLLDNFPFSFFEQHTTSESSEQDLPNCPPLPATASQSTEQDLPNSQLADFSIPPLPDTTPCLDQSPEIDLSLLPNSDSFTFSGTDSCELSDMDPPRFPPEIDPLFSNFIESVSALLGKRKLEEEEEEGDWNSPFSEFCTNPELGYVDMEPLFGQSIY